MMRTVNVLPLSLTQVEAQFRQLDVDHSGTLTENDLKLAMSNEKVSDVPVPQLSIKSSSALAHLFPLETSEKKQEESPPCKKTFSSAASRIRRQKSTSMPTVLEDVLKRFTGPQNEDDSRAVERPILEKTVDAFETKGVPCLNLYQKGK
jgi:hypothetical protein